MTLWTLEPRDTLVLGDGRPFEGSGLQLTSLELPYPSTLAGFLRSRSASDEHGRFRYAGDEAACQQLREQSVHGPWLASIGPDDPLMPLLPAPADGVGLEPEPSSTNSDAIFLVRLGRGEQAQEPGERTNLPGGLELLFLSKSSMGKPLPLPHYWRWKIYQSWLQAPQECCHCYDRPGKLGFAGGPLELRTHVCIEGRTNAASEGKLFSLGHRRFVQLGKERQLSHVRRFQIVARTELSGLQEGPWPFAGERRLVILKEHSGSLPAPPPELIETILREKRARLLLITPAIFDAGWKPNWILEEDPHLQVTLKAAVVHRPETISGWDYATGRPKPAWRAAPAGSVYFLSFEGPEDALEAYLQRHWWQPVSDQEQMRRDGFGLALFGVDQPLAKEASA